MLFRSAGLGPEAVRWQAETFERLCLGQLHETVGPTPQDDPIQHYIQVLSDKTASLIATSARFGAKFAGCRPEIVEIVANYGEKLGVAFQLADDVIDLTSDGVLTGKTPGTDLREKVPTMPALLLRSRIANAAVPDPADTALLALLDSDLTSDEALEEAVVALRPHDVVAETRAQAVAWAQDAIAELDPLPAGPVKDALVSFAESLVDRTS